MDEEILKQIFDELLSSLEALETQSAAALQFLKAKGIATDEEFAPFLAAAGNVSNVRWLAVRVRTAALISSALKPAETPVEAPARESKATPAESSDEADNQTALSEPESPGPAASDEASHEKASPREDSEKENSPKEVTKKNKTVQKKEAA